MQSWSKTDPIEALEWAKAQDSEIGRVVAAEKLAYKDAAGVLKLLENAWASGQELGYSFDKALANIADHAPGLLFQSALLEQLDEIPSDVIKYVANKSPAQAVALMEQYNTKANLEDIAEIWLEQDANAAATWVGQLPQETLDEIASRFAVTSAAKDSQAARTWVNESLPKNSKAYQEALSEFEP